MLFAIEIAVINPSADDKYCGVKSTCDVTLLSKRSIIFKEWRAIEARHYLKYWTLDLFESCLFSLESYTGEVVFLKYIQTIRVSQLIKKNRW